MGDQLLKENSSPKVELLYLLFPFLLPPFYSSEESTHFCLLLRGFFLLEHKLPEGRTEGRKEGELEGRKGERKGGKDREIERREGRIKRRRKENRRKKRKGGREGDLYITQFKFVPRSKEFIQLTAYPTLIRCLITQRLVVLPAHAEQREAIYWLR